MKLKNKFQKFPFFGPFLLIPFRAKTALSYYHAPLINLFKWLFKSKETTNFTYEISQMNLSHMASLISDITDTDYSKIIDYIEEIKGDKELGEHIFTHSLEKDFSITADKEFLPGRRMGWYIFVRILKPKVIVESGVDKGLGSCVIVAALRKNKEEGFSGKYYGTDKNPKAGHLLSGEYAKFGKILYGDSIQSLRKFNSKIDLFINDSDHSSKYEAEEYEAIKNKLSDNAVILGDNSHCTSELLNFSLKNNRHFIFFQEKPKNHWYPGAGIGISFKRGCENK